jgi:hypothetical protein
MKGFIIVIFYLCFPTAFAQETRVQFTMGEVTIKKDLTQKEWQPLKTNETVPDKAVVKTGRESRCELLLPNGSVVKLFDNAMLQVTATETNSTKETSLFALLGNFFFKVKRAATADFIVKSPTSLAAIRGTEFALSNTRTSSEIRVKSGSVQFGDKNGAFMVSVNTGQKSVSTQNAPPSAPVTMNSKELAELNQWSGGTEDQPVKDASVAAAITAPAAAAGMTSTGLPDTPTPAVRDNQPGQTELQENEIPETPEPAAAEEGFKMGFALGAATIDNKLYNQVGLRPYFSIGKLGMALDLSLYIDENGDIRKDNWDSADDIIEKIYYVRYGLQGDPFYVKVGAIDSYRLGYGILMNHYINTIEYPTVIRTGLEGGFQAGNLGMDVMLNDFKELNRPGGLVAGRLHYSIVGKLQIGASAVYDRNQYAALADRDKDGTPDALDDLPDDKKYQVDTDGDGVPDAIDPDADGDGYTDNPQIPGIPYIDPDSTHLKPEPFDLRKAQNRDHFAFAFDIGYPVVDADYLRLILYSQYAKFEGDGGYGITAPGFLAKFAFINLYGEYRILEKKFIPEYFNTTYELDRAFFRLDTSGALIPIAKKQLLESIDYRQKGIVIGADFNLGNYIIFGAEYQNLRSEAYSFKTVRANLDLNTQFVPKIKRAGAYYYQQNAEKLFQKTEGTVYGYRFQYEISANAALVLDIRITHRDLNGDGRIAGEDETIKSTSIQTAFTF